MQVVGILFMLLGVVGLAAAGQWRNGRWEDSARWIEGYVSPHVLAGMGVAGVMVFFAGLMLIWPPAFLLTFGSAVYWLWRMSSSAQAETERTHAPQRASTPQRTPTPAGRPVSSRASSLRAAAAVVPSGARGRHVAAPRSSTERKAG